jgi:hypothetical protein
MVVSQCDVESEKAMPVKGGLETVSEVRESSVQGPPCS